jgi:hypothetical protein
MCIKKILTGFISTRIFKPNTSLLYTNKALALSAKYLANLRLYLLQIPNINQAQNHLDSATHRHSTRA